MHSKGHRGPDYFLAYILLQNVRNPSLFEIALQIAHVVTAADPQADLEGDQAGQYGEKDNTEFDEASPDDPTRIEQAWD